MTRNIFRFFALNIWVACLILITAGSVQAYWVEIKNNLPASDGVKAAAVAGIIFHPIEFSEWAAPGETKSLNFGGAKIGLCFYTLEVTFNKGFPGCGDYIRREGYHGLWCENMTLEVSRDGCNSTLNLVRRGW